MRNFKVIAYQEINKDNAERVGLGKEAVKYEYYITAQQKPIVIKFGRELTSAQNENVLSPRWVELEFEDGTTIFAVVNHFTYNEFLNDDRKSF